MLRIPQLVVIEQISKFADTCAACHSVREELGSSYDPLIPFHDQFNISLTDRDIIPCGWSRNEEAFEYGSFIMSKMYHKGHVFRLP